MMMKPSCSWCKDYQQFEENKQLCILVDCYRKLCEYIAGSPLAKHISSEVGGAPDIVALLNEGLSSDKTGDEGFSRNLAQRSPAPSSSDTPPEELQTACSSEIKQQPPSPLGVNGLQDCNGLSNTDELRAGSPSPRSSVMVEVGSDVVKQESFSSEIPVCEAVAAAGEELCASSMEMCEFGEDIKHAGGTLLLSVEEVLRTLEPDPVPQVECSALLQPSLGASGNINGRYGCSDVTRPHPSLPLDAVVLAPQHPHHNPQPSSGISCSAATPRIPRSNRKRSRSESDSEKIQPLPISTFIKGPSLSASVPVAIKCEPKALTLATPNMAAVPNGGGLPKVGKALMVPNKPVKKSIEQHGPKKAYTKSKQSVPKTKDKTKERLVSNPLVPGSPTKVVYKKPQEKKGCKCGRATQNPSVLTCRGQRCPCYSNRKACLDCICRGCQNSYMANGEKKLEAFAVPEKALEQTRLTLGINLTSIAMKNAGGGGGTPGTLNVTSATGSPMASFLAAGPHEDEALDMRFDC